MPDDPQKRAAESTDPALLVVAPPGCGKTELLAMRAVALVPRLKPNQKILALTFTNRAKANLSERLQQSLGRERFRRHVRVHNFHGHATQVVLSHGRTLGMQLDDLQLPTTTTLGKALKQLSSNTTANRAAEELLGRIKREPLDDDEVAFAIKNANNTLAARVETDRISQNQLHYDDLLRHAQRLLQIDEIANLYQQHYGAVLVDEFQDLSLQQLDIVMRSCTTSRTFAGDPLQGIYSWAGAAPERVEELLRAECGEPIQLAVSYRSSPAVLGMLNKISARMGADPIQPNDITAWPGGGASAVLTMKSLQDEAKVIAQVAQRIVRADPTASVGVISRAGWRRGEIDKIFASITDLPCRHWDLAIENPAILDRVRIAVADMPNRSTVAEAKAAMVAGLDASDVDTRSEIHAAFDQLESEVGPDGNARNVLRRFQAPDPEVAVGPGVHLLNAHTGKGQQFDWVFVCGLEEGHLPGRKNNSGDALKEEERVLLVMLSRARHGVVVTRSELLAGRSGDYTSKPSRWLPDLQAAATMSWEALLAHIEATYPIIGNAETEAWWRRCGCAGASLLTRLT